MSRRPSRRRRASGERRPLRRGCAASPLPRGCPRCPARPRCAPPPSGGAPPAPPPGCACRRIRAKWRGCFCSAKLKGDSCCFRALRRARLPFGARAPKRPEKNLVAGRASGVPYSLFAPATPHPAKGQRRRQGLPERKERSRRGGCAAPPLTQRSLAQGLHRPDMPPGVSAHIISKAPATQNFIRVFRLRALCSVTPLARARVAPSRALRSYTNKILRQEKV